MRMESALIGAGSKSVGILIIAALAVLMVPSIALAGQPGMVVDETDLLERAAQVRVPFIENQGQVEKETVRFYAQTFGGTLFVEDGGILTYNLPAGDGTSGIIREVLSDKEYAIAVGVDPSPTNVNYFLGNDPGNWRSDLSTYNSVSFGQVYEGIDLYLKAYGNNVEKIFTVQPGAEPEAIKVRLEGAQDVKVNEQGQLELSTPLGIVKFTKPVAFQEKDGVNEEIDIGYMVCDEGSYSFQVGAYDSSLPLIIDPLLASTFIGGDDDDASRAIVVNHSTGDVYVAGYTTSSGYPTYPSG